MVLKATFSVIISSIALPQTITTSPPCSLYPIMLVHIMVPFVVAPLSKTNAHPFTVLAFKKIIIIIKLKIKICMSLHYCLTSI